MSRSLRFACTAFAFGAAAAVSALLALVPAGAARAQAAYPEKPIRMIVPFPPGGAVDLLGRLVGQHLGEQLGQSVIVENRAGANGNVGTEVVVRAPADGYTLLFASNGLATNASLYPNRSYTEARNLVPVAYVGASPLIMVTAADAPFNSLKDVLAAAGAKPGGVSYASAGNGSSAHLGTELLKQTAKVDILHVPYKGGAPAIVDLIAGRVSFMLLDPPQAMPQVRSGKLKAILVGSPRRLALLPDVQTTSEAGFTNLETTVWWGLMAPAGTPPAIVEKLNAEVNKALARPDVQTRFKELGVTSQPGSAADFARYLGDQTGKWASVIASAGIKAD